MLNYFLMHLKHYSLWTVAISNETDFFHFLELHIFQYGPGPLGNFYQKPLLLLDYKKEYKKSYYLTTSITEK